MPSSTALAALVNQRTAQEALLKENDRLMELMDVARRYKRAIEDGTSIEDVASVPSWVKVEYPEIFFDEPSAYGFDLLVGAFLDEQEEFLESDEYYRLSQVGQAQASHMFNIFDKSLYRLEADLATETPDINEVFAALPWEDLYMKEAEARADGRGGLSEDEMRELLLGKKDAQKGLFSKIVAVLPFGSAVHSEEHTMV